MMNDEPRRPSRALVLKRWGQAAALYFVKVFLSEKDCYLVHF